MLEGGEEKKFDNKKKDYDYGENTQSRLEMQRYSNFLSLWTLPQQNKKIFFWESWPKFNVREVPKPFFFPYKFPSSWNIQTLLKPRKE